LALPLYEERGGMSIVREGIDKKSGQRWAVKDIDKSIVDDLTVWYCCFYFLSADAQVLHREIDIMKRLQHKNVLQLREVSSVPC
jgi:serine/threonine protein kinase